AFIFETESAITKDMMVNRGIDPTRVAIMPVVTVEDFRTQAVRIVDKYVASGGTPDTAPMIMALDSLGNLSTNKELTDITAGSDTKDMTRAPLLKGAFRVLTLKLGMAGIPLISTNHLYASMSAY